MGFKNDSQRKAVMATLNNGASTRQNTKSSTLAKVKSSKSNLDVMKKKESLTFISLDTEAKIKKAERFKRKLENQGYNVSTEPLGLNGVTITGINPNVEQEPSLDDVIKDRFKSYSNDRLVQRINTRFKSGKNDDDEVHELFRREKAQGFKVKIGFDTYEIEK